MPDKKPKTFGYREEVLEALLKLLGPYDDVTRDNMFGFPAFRASGQIFACVYENGLCLKMPKAAAEAIVQTPGISPFIPFGRARMRQWVYIERKKPASYIKDFPLIEASIHYVRTLKPKKSAKQAGKPSPPANKTASAALENSAKAAAPKSATKAAAKTPEKKSSASPRSASKKKTSSSAPAGKGKSSSSAKTSGKQTPAKKSASRSAAKKKPPKKTAPARKPAGKKAARTAGKGTTKGRK